MMPMSFILLNIALKFQIAFVNWPCITEGKKSVYVQCKIRYANEQRRLKETSLLAMHMYSWTCCMIRILVFECVRLFENLQLKYTCIMLSNTTQYLNNNQRSWQIGTSRRQTR